jgi:hypothetical protein
MKKKTPLTRDESQRSAKVNGKKAAGAKTPKGRQKKAGDGAQTEAQRTRRHRMQVIHCELAQRYDNPNLAGAGGGTAVGGRVRQGFRFLLLLFIISRNDAVENQELQHHAKVVSSKLTA